MGHPTIYPTGVTIFDPDRTYPGYTLFQAPQLGALLINLNGAEVQLWRGLQGFPNKLLPGGQVFGSTAERSARFGSQDQIDLVQVDWEGRVRWRYDRFQELHDPGQAPRWAARQHHDFQREGNPVGYFAPGLEPRSPGGKTLILVHDNVVNPAISAHPLLDDTIIEVDEAGELLWRWNPHQHFDELGFDAEARQVLRRNPNIIPLGGQPLDAQRPVDGYGDWLHINSVSYLGPNRLFEAGDRRFHPDNIIWDAREANIIAIIEKRTGNIVWRLGPRFDGNDAEKRLGWIIGQHHAHLIPKGLPGEGNLLVFDNGGWAGYGTGNPGAPDGLKTAIRDYSRVLEIDPVTLDIVWQYTPREAGFVIPLDAARFYSPFISSAQRLPNGNTLITEGSDGRIFEVTRGHEIVWEYVNPYWRSQPIALNLVYRAYRYPYSWVPQLPEPKVQAIPRLKVADFRVPGAAPRGALRETAVEGASASAEDGSFCVTPEGKARPFLSSGR